MFTQEQLGQLIQAQVAEPLKHNRCGMSAEALLIMAQAMLHIEKTIADTCTLCNGCSARTLQRWAEDPDLHFPRPHRARGGKLMYWLDEIELWKADHPDILARVNEKHRD